MKRTTALLIALAAIVGMLSTGGCGKSYSTKPGDYAQNTGGNNTGGGGDNQSQVTISGFAYGAIDVAAGSTVTWKNNDSVPHTATSDTGSAFAFDTGSIAAGGTSKGITFPQAGTFNYHCTFHAGMHGTIVVH